MAINIGSETAVLSGGSFFRLKQPLQSPGDIFEVDSSAAAVYVGPDSDLTEYRLTYYDPQQPTQLQTADISVNGPFVGNLSALLDTKVSTTGQKARLMAQVIDLYQPTFQREFTIPPFAPARSILIPPVVDLIWSFTPDMPEIPNVRADRTIRLSRVPFLGNGSGDETDILVPTYGRRMVTIQITAVVQVSITLYKVIFLPGLTSGLTPQVIQQSPFVAGGVPGLPIQRSFVLRASNDVAQVFRSDAITSEETPISGVIGMTDYLLISVAGTAPGASVLNDLFIKLSDREV